MAMTVHQAFLWIIETEMVWIIRNRICGSVRLPRTHKIAKPIAIREAVDLRAYFCTRRQEIGGRRFVRRTNGTIWALIQAKKWPRWLTTARRWYISASLLS